MANYNHFDDKVLFMRSMQWQKDSHGLFDYEMKQITQANYKVMASKVAVRKGSAITFDEPGVDIKDKYGTGYELEIKIKTLSEEEVNQMTE